MKPNPGSNEAYIAGCTCARGDNGYGAGAWGGVTNKDTGEKIFWIREDCPLHGTKQEEQDES